MNACVLYFSLTGNTKRFAETISNMLNIPVFDLAQSMPSIIADYDVLILGTPVHGLSPAKPVSSFIEKLPKANEKKQLFSQLMLLEKEKQIRN